VTATSRATILEEQAVSINVEGPLKSKTNEILLEYIDFIVPGRLTTLSLIDVRESY
jgi:hypothetical protein